MASRLFVVYHLVYPPRISACSSSATLPADYFNTMAIDQQAQVASNQLDIQPNDGK